MATTLTPSFASVSDLTRDQLADFECWCANEKLDMHEQASLEWYLEEVRESDLDWADYMSSLA